MNLASEALHSHGLAAHWRLWDRDWDVTRAIDTVPAAGYIIVGVLMIWVFPHPRWNDAFFRRDFFATSAQLPLIAVRVFGILRFPKEVRLRNTRQTRVDLICLARRFWNWRQQRRNRAQQMTRTTCVGAAIVIEIRSCPFPTVGTLSHFARELENQVAYFQRSVCIFAAGNLIVKLWCALVAGPSIPLGGAVEKTLHGRQHLELPDPVDHHEASLLLCAVVVIKGLRPVTSESGAGFDDAIPGRATHILVVILISLTKSSFVVQVAEMGFALRLFQVVR